MQHMDSLAGTGTFATQPQLRARGCAGGCSCKPQSRLRFCIFLFFSELEQQHLARHTQLLTWLGLNLAPMDHTMNNATRASYVIMAICTSIEAVDEMLHRTD
jgi:hypothetical protein